MSNTVLSCSPFPLRISMKCRGEGFHQHPGQEANFLAKDSNHFNLRNKTTTTLDRIEFSNKEVCLHDCFCTSLKEKSLLEFENEITRNMLDYYDAKEENQSEFSFYNSRLKSLRKDSVLDNKSHHIIDISSFDVCLISIDQSGCRLLQDLIESEKVNTETVYEKTKNKLNTLIIDPFGNYLCQKIYIFSNKLKLKLDFINRIRTNINQIAINLHGSRALQSIINNSSDNTIITNIMIDSIIMCMEELITNNNGNHVVQKLLLLVTGENKLTLKINSIINKEFIKIATNKHGCCIIQRIIDYNLRNLLDNSKIQQLINKNINELVKDQYGNYIIQYSLKLEKCQITIDELLQNFEILSKMKYSSNVIENCVKFISKKKLSGLLEKITPKFFIELSIHKYGNYVIQTILNRCSYLEKSKLTQNLIDKDPEIIEKILENKRTGVKIIQKLLGINSKITEFNNHI